MMATFAPKKDPTTAKGSLAHDNTEHQAPPVLHLQAHHIDKLFKGKMPKVGSKIKVHGLVHVGSTSESHEHAPSGGKAKGGEGNTHRTATLHFHKMEIGADGMGGPKDADEETKSAQGAKAEMDKALARQQGGSKKHNDEGYEGSNGGDSTPRGVNAPRGSA